MGVLEFLIFALSLNDLVQREMVFCFSPNPENRIQQQCSK